MRRQDTHQQCVSWGCSATLASQNEIVCVHSSRHQRSNETFVYAEMVVELLLGHVCEAECTCGLKPRILRIDPCWTVGTLRIYDHIYPPLSQSLALGLNAKIIKAMISGRVSKISRRSSECMPGIARALQI